MNEQIGSIFAPPESVKAIGITINCIVKNNGELVMGKGVALEAKNRFKNISLEFGKQIFSQKQNGKDYFGVYFHKESNLWVFGIPTKYHYKDNSDIDLISKSLNYLNTLVNENFPEFNGIENIVALPAVGCGYGNLNWKKQVRPIANKILDGRYVILHQSNKLR